MMNNYKKDTLDVIESRLVDLNIETCKKTERDKRT